MVQERNKLAPEVEKIPTVDDYALAEHEQSLNQLANPANRAFFNPMVGMGAVVHDPRVQDPLMEMQKELPDEQDFQVGLCGRGFQ